MPVLRRYRLLILFAICAFWTGLILLGRQFADVPFLSAPWRSEQGFEDLLRQEGRKTPTRADFVLLGVDQSTLEMPPLSPAELAHNRAFQLMTERPFPWSREVWAILLDKLFAAGAREVLFDFVFNPPNDGDPTFAAALVKYRNRVVLGANVDTSNNNQIIVPNATLIPPPQESDPRVGLVNYWPDPIDGKVRAALFTTSVRQLAGIPSYPGDEVIESFDARGLEQLGYGADVPRDQHAHMLRFSAVGAYPPRTLYEVFDPELWKANYQNGAFFKGKVVLVGAASQVAHDFVATPMNTNTLGPALHLQSMAAALGHEFLTATPPGLMLILVGSAGALAWLLIAFVRRPLTCLLVLVLAAGLYLLAARLAYDRMGFLLLTVPVLSAFLLSGAFSLGFEYVLERIEKLRTRRTLERYVSKNLVKEILDNPGGFYSSLKGVRIPATILFSDIVGFTSLTENADPEALVAQLNEYLSKMTTAVFENGGTLDKFIGDAVMAVWGNVRSQGQAEDTKCAARAALAMRRELKILNDDWFARGIAPFAIGIGINQGSVLGGNIGSQEKADPTVIGDAVNLASRLEGLTRTYGADILVGPTATDFVRDEFHVRSVARVQVKGKTEPVEIATLIGARNDPTLDAELLRHLETYEDAFQKFRARHFPEAKILLSQFLEFYPNDHLAKMYLERALEYEEAPPDAAWNAVEVFKKK
ncbi:MAG TPA: adenylate/guanylate cyclase domain-containing protein [Chthoniobacterales bacterium]|nr:adenylate/guanylate cyclase domain-containing protein [Chthoniobacterales bacterium]